MNGSIPGPRRLAAAIAAAAALAATPATADLVVMSDGSFLKARGVTVEGERARVELLSGGAMVLPLLRIERVVDDEVPPQAEVEELAAAAPGGAATGFALAFDAAQPRPETPYGELIYETAQRHGLNPALVAAVARAESAYDAAAVSHKGARGLMQLMPATAARFGVGLDRITDPATNLDAGVRYLAWLAGRFDGDLARVLAAYNAGEGTVDRYGGVPPYRETRGYVRKIFATLGLDASPALDPAAAATATVASLSAAAP